MSKITKDKVSGKYTFFESITRLTKSLILTYRKQDLDLRPQGFGITKLSIRKYLKSPNARKVFRDTNVSYSETLVDQVYTYIVKKYEEQVPSTKLASKDKSGSGWLTKTQPGVKILVTNNYSALSGVTGKVKKSIRNDISKYAKLVDKEEGSTTYRVNDARSFDPEKEGGIELITGALFAGGIGNKKRPHLHFENRSGRKIARAPESHMGHVFGPYVRSFMNVARGKNFEILVDQFQIDVPKFKKLEKEIVEIDADMEHKRILDFNKTLSGYKDELVFTVFEAGGSNTTSGAKLANQAKDFLKEAIGSVDITNIGQSKSGKELLLEGLIAAFLGKKPKKYKKTKKYHKRIQIERKIPYYQNELKPIKAYTQKEDKEQRKYSPPNLRELLILINTQLHDAMQDTMGKGGAYATLNYRTGRLAHSAELTDLTMSKSGKSLIGEIDYMRSPYSVFEPGGHLNKGQLMRDPKMIINKSIRTILKEQLGRNVAFFGGRK